MILPLPCLWDCYKTTIVICNGYGVWDVHWKVLRKPKRTSLILMSFHPSSPLHRRLMLWGSLQPCSFCSGRSGWKMCRKDRPQIEFSCCIYTINFPQNKKTLTLKLYSSAKYFTSQQITSKSYGLQFLIVLKIIFQSLKVTGPLPVPTNDCLLLPRVCKYNFYIRCAVYHRFLQNFFFF